MDRNLNELLKWSIENSTASSGTNPTGQTDTDEQPQTSARGLPAEALAALFGGPSDAELMQASMSVVTSTDPAVSLDDKLVAFDNMEQLVEQVDNANNLGALGLWSPLLALLDNDAAPLRKMAAWCLGTAVQNNAPAQERLLALGGIPRLVGLAVGVRRREGGGGGGEGESAGAGAAQEQEQEQEQVVEEEDGDVRRKAVYALSSAVRNYQPAMDVCTEELAKAGRGSGEKVEATNMDAVDVVINGLKAAVAKKTE